MLLSFIYKIYCLEYYNSFEKIYKLLNNKTLLKETCSYINRTENYIPSFVVVDDITPLDNVICIRLYKEYMILSYNKSDERSFIYEIHSKLFYKKNTNINKFIDDCIKDLNKEDIILYLDTNNININKTNFDCNFIKDIKIIDSTFRSYLLKDTSYKFIYEYEISNKKYYYLLPDSKEFIINLLFNKENYNKKDISNFNSDSKEEKDSFYFNNDSKKDSLNNDSKKEKDSKEVKDSLNFNYDSKDCKEVEDSKKDSKEVEDSKDSFNNDNIINNYINNLFILFQSDDIFLQRFIDLILEPSTQFNLEDSNIFIYYEISKYLLENLTFLSLYSNKIKFNDLQFKKMKLDFLIPSCIRYSKNISNPISALDQLRKLQISNEISKNMHEMTVDDVYRVILKNINLVFRDDLYREIRKMLLIDEYKLIIRKYINNIFKIIFNKIHFYIKMSYRINEAENYKYFIDESDRIGLRNYKNNLLKKDYQYIKKKCPKPSIMKCVINFDTMTLPSSHLSFLSNSYLN